MNDKNKKILFGILLTFVIGIVLAIRINNIATYNSWWADDGGAHIRYVETLIEKGRLPEMNETYLAWHEPGYYWLMARWQTVGEFFHVCENRDDISIGENR